MPFIGTRDEAAELKRVVLERGATAFKHKSLNHWDEKALLEGKLNHPPLKSEGFAAEKAFVKTLNRRSYSTLFVDKKSTENCCAQKTRLMATHVTISPNFPSPEGERGFNHPRWGH
jgi:hypothetical protein